MKFCICRTALLRTFEFIMNLPAPPDPTPDDSHQSSALSSALAVAMAASPALRSVAERLGVRAEDLASEMQRAGLVAASSSVIEVLNRVITDPLVAGLENFDDRDVKGTDAVDLLADLHRNAVAAVGSAGVDIETLAIRSVSEDACWSNDDGWVEPEDATAFYAFEKGEVALPTIGMSSGDVAWIRLSQALLWREIDADNAARTDRPA